MYRTGQEFTKIYTVPSRKPFSLSGEGVGRFQAPSGIVRIAVALDA
jgi:hypothetical protein